MDAGDDDDKLVGFITLFTIPPPPPTCPRRSIIRKGRKNKKLVVLTGDRAARIAKKHGTLRTFFLSARAGGDIALVLQKTTAKK